MSLRERFEHPVLGNQPRYTAWGLWGVALIILLVGGEATASRLIPTAGAPPRLVFPLDAFAALAIIMVALSAVAGIGYGLVNGGPLLAALLPCTPVAVALVVGRTVLPTVDAAILLAGAAAGSGVATIHAWPAPELRLRPVPVGVGTTIAFAIVAAWLIRGLLRNGGPHLLGGLVVAGLLLGVAGLTAAWALGRSLRPRWLHLLAGAIRRRFAG